jgi:antirestriction protein ArdC
MKIDIYKEITDKIIAALEEGGLPPWVRPWSKIDGETCMPSNFVSGKEYRGVNILALWASQQLSGYESNRWLTYKQASEKGLQVRKGEHGSHVVFWKFFKKKDDDGRESKTPMARTYTVFNLEQCDGYEPTEIPEPEWDRDEKVQDFIDGSDASIIHKGASAFFSPKNDKITMPEHGRFKTSEDYYATLLHELTHWTGHKTRLNRPFNGGFGSPDYAREELVAELGAAFLCANFKIDGQLQHEQYIKSWIKVLKDDKNAIVRASSLAQQSTDYLLKKEAVNYSEE